MSAVDNVGLSLAVVLWLGLIYASAHLGSVARSLRRRRFWRFAMAALAGLSATFENERQKDDHR